MMFKILMFILWFFVWLFLSWPPNIKVVFIGLIVSLFVTFMTIDILSPRDIKKRKKSLTDHMASLVWFLIYLIVFLWECLKANIDVAYRVVRPDLPIKPGTVKVKVGLKSDIGLTFLASSLTLTPGTTTIDIDKERGFIYIHWLYIKDGDKHLKIVQKFESILKRIFD